MKILLIVPDGVGVRNYLYSDFVKQLENRGNEVMLYHQLSEAAINEVSSVQKNITSIRRIPVYTESYLSRILRESTTFARILINKEKLNNETILAFWTKKPSNFKQKVLFAVSETLGTILSKSYNAVLLFEEKFRKEVAKNATISTILADFDDLKPDFILSLHQRAPITAAVIEAAKRRNIKTATVIFSWDNVPKARLVTKYDRYFVWSQLMKDELKLLYPEVRADSVSIVGTPQFEFYFKDEFKVSKESFFAKHDLDLNKKTVCFSSNDASSPYEADYFNDVCEQIASIPDADRPQILLRKSPVDRSKRFDKIIEKYASLVIQIDPDWRVEKDANDSFTNIYPAYADVSLLVNTVFHSDLVVNLGSTMAHDFAVADKPCLYLNYDPVNDSVFKVEEVYNFQHFRSLKELDAVVWLNSKSEIAVTIQQVLENPSDFAKDKKRWMEKIVRNPLSENADCFSRSIQLNS